MLLCLSSASSFFFFNDTATTEIYTLSLHDALPISDMLRGYLGSDASPSRGRDLHVGAWERGVLQPNSHVGDMVPVITGIARSEEHTSELQSQSNLVCRLLLEKKY